MAFLQAFLLLFSLSAWAHRDRTEPRRPPDLSSARSITALAGEISSAHWRFDSDLGGELVNRFHATPDGRPLPAADRAALIEAMRQWMIAASAQSREQPARFEEVAGTLIGVIEGSVFAPSDGPFEGLPFRELAPGVLGAFEGALGRQDFLSEDARRSLEIGMMRVLGRFGTDNCPGLQGPVLGLIARRPQVGEGLAEMVGNVADDWERDPGLRFRAEQARFYIRMHAPVGR